MESGPEASVTDDGNLGVGVHLLEVLLGGFLHGGAVGVQVE